MGNPYPGFAKAGDLGVVGPDHMRCPRTIAHPANVFVQIDGSHSEGRNCVIVVFGVLGQVEVQALIDSVQGSGLVVNLGQGLTPDTPVAGVEAFVTAVKEWTK